MVELVKRRLTADDLRPAADGSWLTANGLTDDEIRATEGAADDLRPVDGRKER